MCGIVALLGPDTVRYKADLGSAISALRHRGPDEEGRCEDELFAMGHTRLSVIDLTSGGSQPMQKGDLVLIFNGEIYNYLNLRSLLEREGVEFRSESDTEVLLELVRTRWSDCLPMLDGMFAFVAVDRRRRTALCARDRLGEKPLLYCARPGVLVVGSETGPFARLGLLGRSLNLTAIAQFLCLGYTLPPHTMYANVMSLLPGGYMEVSLDSGGVRLGRYYDISNRIMSLGTRAAEEPDYHAEFTQAVTSRMIADVDLGLMLSGGVDSTLVTCLAAQVRPGRLRAYTSAPDGYGEGNEIHVAEENCVRLGIEHGRVLWRMAEYREELLDTVCGSDMPFADVTSWAIRRIARKARADGLKVLLSGDGGDELLAGYPKRRLQKGIVLLEHAIGACGRRGLGLGLSNLCPSPLRRIRKLGRLLRTGSWQDAFLVAMGNALFPEETRQLVDAGPEVEGFTDRKLEAEQVAAEPQSLITLLDFVGHVRGNALFKCDFYAMREGIEIRVPLLAPQLVERMVPVSGRLLVTGIRGKGPMRRLLKARMPQIKVTRAKVGFTPFDLSSVVQEMFPQIERRVMEGDLRRRSRVAARVVDHALADYAESQGANARSLWHLFVIEEWARRRGYCLQELSCG